jgi:hypothetical protein
MTMVKYEVECIKVRETKSVNVYVRLIYPVAGHGDVTKEQYLINDPREVLTRDEGTEMPIFMRLPLDIAEPLAQALNTELAR